MMHLVKPFIHLVDTDMNYVDVAKRWMEQEFQYPVLTDPGGIHAIRTALEHITGKTIFVIAHDSSDIGGVRLVSLLRERFRYPAYYIVLIPKDDHALAAEVLRYDAEPFSKDPPVNGPPYNLGEYFKERILFGERLINRQSVDELTGAYLRGQALEMWRKDFISAKKKRKSTAFVYLDLNYFGAINKALTEPVVDALVLSKFGKYLLDIADSDDIVCRQGGDEFMVIMMGTERASAKRRAEQFIQMLRNAMSDMTINAFGMKVPVTFSAGYHVIHPRSLRDDPHEALIHGAKIASVHMATQKRKMHIEIMRGPLGPTVRKLLEELEKQKKGL